MPLTLTFVYFFAFVKRDVAHLTFTRTLYHNETVDIQVALTILHVIGTVLGVGGATFAEIFYIRAKLDGVIDPQEGGFLKTTYMVLRIGMVLLLVSGFGYLLYLRLNDITQALYGAKLWTKLIITMVIVVNALLLQFRKVPFWLGSAISLASWYTAMAYGIMRPRSFTLAEGLFIYLMIIAITCLALAAVRRRLGVTA